MDTDLPAGSFNSIGHLSTIGYHTLPSRMHHSTSTPAGVDGAGGGSRTPPATPKKGGKMLAIRVQMLDDTISMFQVQSKAYGRVLFDQVCRQLHLLEADYFGLEYQDANFTKYWLDVEKPLCRQIGLSMLEPTLRFCVKFYTPDPARLEEEFTRYLFCLQVKRDLAQGCIQCNENTAALMASYIVQAECGDFVPEDYPDHTYLSGYKFFPGQDSESERRIMENHKKHIGQSPAEADLNLLETARRCELYGVKMHPAKDHDNVPLNLAVAHMGILVFQNFTKINTFSWAKIRKISFKRKKFLIKLHPEGYGYYRDVVEFFFEGRNECKNFWKKCVENHGFFRCTSVPRPSRHKTRVMSRGSSFRYSGKTQKQIVEFVRDNYVKRQTFQRSGSFRRSLASPSAARRVPSASSATPATLAHSVSAHPLLPLPPGSGAISLEWERQPHYLEASLMMKGYSAESARARASGAVRQPLPATTCAAMRDRVTAPEVVTHAEVNHHPMEDSPLPHRTTTASGSPGTTWSRATWENTSAVRTHTDENTVDEDKTVSSASLCMSPRSENNITTPLYASTPLVKQASEAATSCNGLDQVDNRKSDPNKNYDDIIHTNGNIGDDNLVSQSTISMDILSGGESDACDTLTRTNQNNNSIISTAYLSPTGTESRSYRRFTDDIQYCVAKELLMTERTYKKDLELVTVSWSEQVSNLTGEPSDVMDALGRPCLALEPLALPQGALLANLDRCITLSIHETEPKEPNYKKISDILHDYLLNTYDAYKWYSDRAGALVARLENVRRTTPTANTICHAFDTTAPLPLTLLILRPLHRLIYYKDIAQQLSHGESSSLVDTCTKLCDSARIQLEHCENHVALCQLQRDIIGYEKLLLPDREFIQFGCLYKHSSKGLMQRMIFLFTDILVIASKSSSGSQFRAHAVLSLHTMAIEKADMPHSFTLTYDDNNTALSASNAMEFMKWYDVIQEAIDNASEVAPDDIVVTHMDPGSSTSNVSCVSSTGVAWTHVCWHRATSLHRDRLHVAMMTQQSGYLLRKFKNSHGWQKLWVVFAAFALFFYKSWQDVEPLASLPLLGYTVSPPNESDAINKEFVFKLQFKNHVYFFRADTQYTYTRWTEALQQATSHSGPD